MIWRENTLSLKEFYSLSKEKKNDYIKELLLVPEKDRTDLDKHILKFYHIKPVEQIKHFISLD